MFGSLSYFWFADQLGPQLLVACLPSALLTWVWHVFKPSPEGERGKFDGEERISDKRRADLIGTQLPDPRTLALSRRQVKQAM